MSTSRSVHLFKKAAGGVGKSVAYAIMGLFAAMAIYPIIWLVINSFKANQNYIEDKVGFPQEWFPSNYAGAWDTSHMGQLILNSVIYTVVGVVLVVFLACLAGFAFSKIQNKATAPVYGSFVLGILLSIQSLMVPLFIEIFSLDLGLGTIFEALGIGTAKDFHLFYNTRVGMIIIYVASGLPVAIYLATEFIKGIPTALVEAARIDGARYFAIFLRIIMPMSAPIAMTIAILNVPGIWNEFALINIVVSDESMKSLPVGVLKFSSVLQTDYGKLFAGLVIALLPMLIFYIIFRKQITRGVAGGAVKG